MPKLIREQFTGILGQGLSRILTEIRAGRHKAAGFLAFLLLATSPCHAMTKEEAKTAYQGLKCRITGVTDAGYPTCAVCDDLTNLVAHYDPSWDVVPELTTITIDTAFSTPNNGTKWDDTSGPTATYPISNMKLGTYIVSVYGTGPDASSDSLHYGIDSIRVGSITLDSHVTPGLHWSSKLQGGGVAEIAILDNLAHTLQLFAREDGTSITQVKLELKP